MPDKYTINIYCTSNGALLDWVTEAAHLQVIEGDFYRTGKSPPRTHAIVALAQTWEIIG